MMGLWTINQYQLNVIAVTKLYRLRLKINKKKTFECLSNHKPKYYFINGFEHQKLLSISVEPIW